MEVLIFIATILAWVMLVSVVVSILVIIGTLILYWKIYKEIFVNFIAEWKKYK